MSDQTKAADLATWLRERADDHCPVDGRPKCTTQSCLSCRLRDSADLLKSQVTEIKRLREVLNATSKRNRTVNRKKKRYFTEICRQRERIAELEAALTLTPEKIEAASRAAGLPCTSRGDDLAKAALLSAGFQEPAKEQP